MTLARALIASTVCLSIGTAIVWPALRAALDDWRNR